MPDNIGRITRLRFQSKNCILKLLKSVQIYENKLLSERIVV